MGFLSRLLGGEAEKIARDLLNGNTRPGANAPANAPAPQQSAPQQPAWQPQEAEPSGFSWGPQMPAEENQYNFGGSYVQYFEHVYRAEFPEYRVEFSDPRYGRGKVVTFFSGSATALIVELLPKSTDSKKLRADCAARGIPYLRFYYDREGWWNTRAYVVKRTRDALGGQR